MVVILTVVVSGLTQAYVSLIGREAHWMTLRRSEIVSVTRLDGVPAEIDKNRSVVWLEIGGIVFKS